MTAVTQVLWRELRDHHVAEAEKLLKRGLSDPGLAAGAMSHSTLAFVYQSRIDREGECRCPEGMAHHAGNCPEFPDAKMERS